MKGPFKYFEPSPIQDGNTFIKPVAYNLYDFPLCAMDDRPFEILLFRIFQERINSNENSIRDIHDYVALMAGVGEAGRDSILSLNGKNTGVIQCKKTINYNLGDESSCTEIIKFCLHSIIDTTMIDDIENFRYYLCVSRGFTSTANIYIASFNAKIIADSRLDDWIIEIIEKFKTLKSHFDTNNLADIKKRLFPILEKIKIIPIIPAEINKYITLFGSSISNEFFQIKLVTDNSVITEHIKYIVENYLDPIIKSINSNITNDGKLNKNYNELFSAYINRVIEKHSVPRTIIFKNAQKKIEEYYSPLTVESKDDAKLKIKIHSYESNFIPQYQKVIIVDNGGMGKSTIMKWLFLSSIKEKKGIPFFIELMTINKDNSIFDELQTQFKQFTTDEISESELRKIFFAGNYIFFFDGLDEVKDNIEKTIKEINDFISSVSPSSHFIITSRPDRYTNSLIGFKEFKIQNLSEFEIFEFIKLIGGNDQKADKLINTLSNGSHKEVLKMANTPLLASLLFTKYDYKETIPLKKTEFFFEIYEALFESHDITKDAYIRPKRSGLTHDYFFRVLSMLGYLTIQKQQGIEYTREKFISNLEDVKKYFNPLTFDAELFISDVTLAVPFFYKDGINYTWTHKLFQEYFAAMYIHRELKEKQEETILNIYHSERIQSLINILDFYYDLDYLLFRNIILKDIIIEFKKLEGKINSEFRLPIDMRKEFLEILFLQKIILFSEESTNPKKEIDQIFKIGEKLASEHFNDDRGKRASHIMIPLDGINLYTYESKKKEKFNTIANLLINKNSKLFRGHSFKVNFSLKKKSIELANIILHSQVLPINEKIMDVIKSEAIIQELLNLLSSLPRISKEEAEKIWKEINESIPVSNAF